MDKVRNNGTREHHAGTAAEPLEQASNHKDNGAGSQCRQHRRSKGQRCATQQQWLAPNDIRQRSHEQLAYAHSDEEARDGQLNHGAGRAEVRHDRRHDRQVHIRRKRRCCGQQRQGCKEGKADHASRRSTATMPRIHRSKAQPKKTTAFMPTLSQGAESSTTSMVQLVKAVKGMK